MKRKDCIVGTEKKPAHNHVGHLAGAIYDRLKDIIIRTEAIENNPGYVDKLQTAGAAIGLKNV
jgi:hypothetical protein